MFLAMELVVRATWCLVSTFSADANRISFALVP